MMMRVASIIFVLAVVGSGPALAVSAAARAACKGDAYRLCGAVVHDEAKRHACMRAHAAQLSKGCLAALHRG